MYGCAGMHLVVLLATSEGTGVENDRAPDRAHGAPGARTCRQVFKWLFILFNIAMLCWSLAYCGSLGQTINTASSEAEQAGTALGGTLGVGMLMFLWMVGDVILGIIVLLTRGKTLIVEEAGQ